MRLTTVVVCTLVLLACANANASESSRVSAQLKSARQNARVAAQWDFPWKKKAAAGAPGAAGAAPATATPAAGAPGTPAGATPPAPTGGAPAAPSATKPASSTPPAPAKPAAGGKTCGSGGQCYKADFCKAYGGKVQDGVQCTGAGGKVASGLVCCTGAVTKTAQSHAKAGMAKLGSACEFRGLNGKCQPSSQYCPGDKAKSNCAGDMTCCTTHQESELDKNIKSGKVAANFDAMGKQIAERDNAERAWRRTHPNGF